MIKDNLAKVRERVKAACLRSGSDPASVTVIAVSKGRSIEQIEEAARAGITDIGENKVQEALLKYKALSTINGQPSTIKWHMVGHLQTNKVKEAVRIFDFIHSVDSLRLAQEIDKQAAKIQKVQDVLIEVKTSPEVAKYGVSPDEAGKFIQEASRLKNIRIRGLMTIAPAVDNPEKTRPYFQALKRLFNQLSAISYQLSAISMGMSDDFEVAVEEGATMVRIGRAIFAGT